MSTAYDIAKATPPEEPETDDAWPRLYAVPCEIWVECENQEAVDHLTQLAFKRRLYQILTPHGLDFDVTGAIEQIES